MAQWLQALLDTGQAPTKTALCHLAGVSRSRVIQYLNLLNLPTDYVLPLRYFDGLQETQLRPLVGMGAARQRQGLNKEINRMGGAVLKLAGRVVGKNATLNFWFCLLQFSSLAYTVSSLTDQ